MSFADNFWTQDYNSGFKLLFEQLHQGINENEEFIQLFQKRMESELIYGNHLESIEKTTFAKRKINQDYVSSIKNAFEKINENFMNQGSYHLSIGSIIKLNVLDPFSKWCKDHQQRIEYSESIINDKFKLYKSKKLYVDKLQKRYFNKCRMLEEFKSHFTEEELKDQLNDLSFQEKIQQQQQIEEHQEQFEQLYYFGNITYDFKAIKSLLIDILTNVPLFSHKVAILGTYHNVSTGSSITQWIIDNMPQFNKNLDKAEAFGQELINNGFLRLIGSMGKNFINSSQFYYQWKPIVFEITSMPNPALAVAATTPEASTTAVPLGSSATADSSLVKDYFEDVKEAIGINSIDYSDKSQFSKLMTEVNQLDKQYLNNVIELDKLRCEFEEIIMDHLTFMQKCELDRLKALKKVTFDFLSTFVNSLSKMKNFIDELLLLEETIHPTSDLKFFIENFSTGKFNPQVTLYDNYYDSNINQTFGVDLNIKSRLDKRVVPLIIQCILSHLDSVYPELENDEARINLWTEPIHLTQIHKLRFQLNDINDSNAIAEILKQHSPQVVTNVLKLYFMELPDSIIPYNNNYDVIKLLYQNYPIIDESKTNSRINGIQNVLAELPKYNLATLDAILTHLKRLIEIIGSKEPKLAQDFQASLCKEFGHLILRPKSDIPETNHDKHQINFINDLFNNKDSIFDELRRKSSMRQQQPGGNKSNSLSRESSSKLVSPAGSLSSHAHTHAKPSTLAAKSKSRLEARLQSAVKRSGTTTSTTKKPTPPKDEPSSSTSPQPSTGSSSGDVTTPGLLRRSLSPTKKKLNSYLDKNNGTPASPPVSSRPLKKDVLYYNNNSNPEIDTEGNPPIPPPKFAPSLGRRTSVKDLAEKFESQSREASPEKGE
ncbi:rga8 [[Candida] subhashii]|uniref:Rga8 n=1 Tax=[Candida] subhashii TaxID=561895 RepID=A0A8J5Q313_9ASCO|nr:rga8 [[Candida] subhashii]KAG7661019.1 rga8 [[Candida] subhashii]